MARSANDLIVVTEKWFAKAPHLPPNIREVLVKIAPILALVFGVLGVLGSLAGLGILTFLAPFAAMGGAYGMSYYGTGMVAALVWLVSSALMLAAFPNLRSRKTQGWNLLFWSEVINLAGSLIALNFVSGLIGALIGFYILFQIKSYYK